MPISQPADHHFPAVNGVMYHRGYSLLSCLFPLPSWISYQIILFFLTSNSLQTQSDLVSAFLSLAHPTRQWGHSTFFLCCVVVPGGWCASRARKAAPLISSVGQFLISWLQPGLSACVLWVLPASNHIPACGDFRYLQTGRRWPFCSLLLGPVETTPLPCPREMESSDAGFRVSVGGISKMPINFPEFLYSFSIYELLWKSLKHLP